MSWLARILIFAVLSSQAHAGLCEPAVSTLTFAKFFELAKSKEAKRASFDAFNLKNIKMPPGWSGSVNVTGGSGGTKIRFEISNKVVDYLAKSSPTDAVNLDHLVDDLVIERIAEGRVARINERVILKIKIGYRGFHLGGSLRPTNMMTSVNADLSELSEPEEALFAIRLITEMLLKPLRL